jgi:abortive infection bacteriophage resistance protein
MKINYSKPSTLPQDLIPLLKGRGLAIADDQKAVNYLTNIGYFRLSAYCFPLLKNPKSDHIYKPNATFDLVMNMYRFDRKLRILLFNEIEKIEVAIRSAMNNIISNELNDIFWVTNPANFKDSATFVKTTNFINSEISKSKEEFIAHFENKYSNPYPPVWMINEVVSFGILCTIFNNLKYRSAQKKVASYFGLSVPVFSSWIVLLTNLRNICGHHSRTWNREIPLIPAPLKNPVFPWIDETTTDPKRIYFRICIIKYLLCTVSPNNTFTQKLKNLLTEYPTINIKAMGFPADWESERLWVG